MDSQDYQSLRDPHLNEYFNNKRIRRHLIKAGLINRHGNILPPTTREATFVRRTKRRQAETALSHAITNYVIEEERKRRIFIHNHIDLAMKRSRIQKIRESRQQKQRSMSHSFVNVAKRSTIRNAHTPPPKIEKRSPIRVKTARSPPINVKNQALRRPATAKQQLNDDFCEVTMIYYGPLTSNNRNNWSPPKTEEIIVMQQHCGGENLIVFKGFVKPNETFTFESRRHQDYPFALALYINGLIDSRISVCCEYKHKHNVRLGSKYGLFGIYDVIKSQPCRVCRFEQTKKKILSTASVDVSPSPYRKPFLTSEFRIGDILRTPTTSPEREKTPSKKEINRISTVVQASHSPRTLSPAPSQTKDEINESKKKDNGGQSSSTSGRSDPSSSDILFKNVAPHHSSEPILTKRDTDDDDESSNTSKKSGISPIRFSEDDDNHDSLKLLPEIKKTNNYSTRSSSSTSSKKSNSSSSIALIKTNDNHVQSNRSSSSATLKRLSSSSSSSSNFFSEKEDNRPVSKLLTEDADTEKQLSRSSSKNSKTSDASLKNKTDEKLIKERNLSASSSSTDIFKNLLSTDRQSHASETSENSHHSIKNKPESPRSSISSTDNQQVNDIITQNPVKSDISLTSDDDTFKSNSITKQKGRNEEEPLTTKSEKTPARQYRAVENIILVWLDATIDDTKTNTINTKFQLRQVSRTLRTFTDPTKCIQLFKEIKNEKIFLIISGNLSENILQQIDDYSQLTIIYIYCQQKDKYEHLLDQYDKLKGIYTDISTICEHLKIDSKQWDNDLNTFQISSMITNELKFNSQQLLFIQNQLFKEYLLDIKYDDNSIQDLIEYCQKLYIENENELELIKQFQENYQLNKAIDWYTKDCFIYHMLNRAIRMKDIKILFQMGFFIRDINQQLEEDYSSTVHRSTLTVYRGQGLKMEYFEELKQNQNGLLSFNGFVSTSRKQNVASEFAQRSLLNGFPIAVLFRIKIDPKTTSAPFISLENLSSNPSEYEILLSFKSIFYIELIEQKENNLWQIDLTLTDQISPYIQIENKKFNHLIDYEKLGELLIEMNELDKAKDLYEINLPSNKSPKYTYVYNQLASIYTKLEVYNQAILYYNISLQTKSNETLNDFVTISNIHKEIGKIFYKQNKIREALEKFQYALDIQLEHLSSTDLSLIDTYEIFAVICEENEDYETALEYYQKQLDIQEESSLLNQSDLALTHFKIAICLENLEQFDEAMEHIQQSIDMSPSNDLELNDRQAVRERIREQLE